MNLFWKIITTCHPIEIEGENTVSMLIVYLWIKQVETKWKPHCGRTCFGNLCSISQGLHFDKPAETCNSRLIMWDRFLKFLDLPICAILFWN